MTLTRDGHIVYLLGNLGKDPEMKYIPNGTAVTNFSMATNRSWTNSDGSKGEETVWWRIAVWGKQGENANEYLSKGRQVLLEGRMIIDKETGQPRIWTDDSGVPHTQLEVNADGIKYLGNGRSNGNAAAPRDIGDGRASDDEIPF